MADLTSAILECLAGTLIPNTEVVLAAQQRLYELEQTPGVLNTFLGIVTNVDGVEARLRLAASMRVKRIVSDNWGYTVEDGAMLGRRFVNIGAEDREVVRQNLIPHALMPERFKPIINMLLDALFVIVRCDLDTHADHFAAQCLAAVQGAAQDTVLNAVKCYVTLFKVTVYVIGRVTYPRYNAICNAAYEVLLPMLSSLLQAPLTEQSGRVAEAALKAVYKSLQMYTPTFMRAESVQDTLVALLCGFVTQPVPEEDREEVADSAENSEGDHYELKTRKWAMRILHALMHAKVPKTLPKNLHKGYSAWAKSWLARYGSAAATVAHTVIQQHKTGVVPMSDRCWYYTLQIIDVSVDNAVLYKNVIKPNLEAIVLDGVMRALAISRNDLEEWHRDPSGFVVQISTAVIFRSTHRDAARRLLSTLVSTRTRSALAPIMALIQTILAQYAASDAAGRAAMLQVKDGALSAVSALHKYLSSKEYAEPTARLIEEHVGMELTEPATPPVLAVRGLNVIASYVTLPFSKEFLYPVVQFTISSLRSGDRSLQLEGANALSKLTRVRAVLKALKPDVATLLKTVLELMATTVSETLGIVMRRLLERFSAELVPHALAIVQQLVVLTENAMGVVASSEQRFREQQEDGTGALAGGGDDDDFFDDDDSAATEALRAAGQYIESLATIVEALDGHDNVLAQVEVMVLPLLNHIFKTENTELLAEALRLIQAVTYSGSCISETMWSIFPTIVQSVHSDWGCHYVEDVVPPLVNYATANDGVELFQVAERVEGILSVPEKFFMSPEDEASAQRSAILLRTLLGNCGKGQIAAFYPRILAMCVPAMEKTESGNVYFCMLVLDCVAALCFHDPVLFLTQLQATGLLARCFNAWFSLIEHLTAAQVLEYPMLAMSALVTAVPTTALPAELQPHAHVLVGKMVEMLFQIYKAELENEDEDNDDDDNRGDELFNDIDSDKDADDDDDDDGNGEDGAEHGAETEETVENIAKSMEAKLTALANDAAAARSVVGGGGANFRAEEIPFKTDMDKENVFERYLNAIQLWVQRDGAAFPDIAHNITAADGAVAPLLNYANKRAGEVKAELEAADQENEDEEGEDDEDGFEEDDLDDDITF